VNSSTTVSTFILGMLKHAHSWRALRHTIANGGAKQSKVPEVIPFDDGDELDVPGRLRVIHTPGHTEGHRCGGTARLGLSARPTDPNSVPSMRIIGGASWVSRDGSRLLIS
jgi:hypothetical protein